MPGLKEPDGEPTTAETWHAPESDIFIYLFFCELGAPPPPPAKKKLTKSDEFSIFDEGYLGPQKVRPMSY